MAEIQLQDPLSSEIQSPLIAGLTEAMNKISAGLDMTAEYVSDSTMKPVEGQMDQDPTRIYQVESGKRLWLTTPPPEIRINGALVSSEDKSFSIDYIGGSITFFGTYRPGVQDDVKASFTHISGLENVIDKISSAQQSANTAQQSANTAQQSANIAAPVGAIMWFGASSPPSGWLVCNGAEVSRSVYASLFKVIGTVYGIGDDTSTFALTGHRDRVDWRKTRVGVVKEAGLPNITGTFSPVFEDSDVVNPTGAFYFEGTARDAFGTGSRGQYGISMDASRSNQIYGKSTTVQPPAVTLLPCIKY